MSLRQVTDLQEIRDTRRLTSTEWGAFLSIDEYIHREEVILGHTKMCKDRIKVWGLYTDEGRVAACEAVERPALVQKKGGEIKSASSFSIGAVFTPEEHRGKGYASVMMRQMASELPNTPCLTDAEIIKATGVSEVDNKLRISVLWSDVGLFYEKFGWKATSVTQHVFEIEKVTANGTNGHHQNGHQNGSTSIKYLDEHDIYKLADNEAKNFPEHFSKFPFKGNYKSGIVPDHTLYEWHFARAKFLSKYAKVPEPTKFGVQIGDSWMAWHHMYNARELVILRLQLSRVEDLKLLIDAAKKHILEDGFSLQIDKILIWDQEREWNEYVNGITDFYKAAEQCGAKCEEREASIPCLMFVDPELQKEECSFVDHGKLTWT